MDWSHDDSTFITISKVEFLLRIFDAKSFELLSTYKHTTGATVHEPKSAKISKDSKFIGVGYSNNQVVILYNTPPFNVYFVRDTGTADGILTSMDFNYASNQFVSCHWDKKIRTWNLPATGATSGPSTHNL